MTYLMKGVDLIIVIFCKVCPKWIVSHDLMQFINATNVDFVLDWIFIYILSVIILFIVKNISIILQCLVKIFEFHSFFYHCLL